MSLFWTATHSYYSMANTEIQTQVSLRVICANFEAHNFMYININPNIFHRYLTRRRGVLI